MKPREVFRRNFRQIYIERGLTQQDVADAVGVSRSTVSCWLLGKAYPRADVVDKLSKYLGVPVSALVVDENAEDVAEEISEEQQILFRLARDARPEALRAAAAVLKSMESDNSDT